MYNMKTKLYYYLKTIESLLFIITSLLCFGSCVNNASDTKILFAVNLEDGMAYFQSPTGKLFFCNRFNAVQGFSEGLAAVEINGMWGFIDKEGKQVIPCIYDDVGSYSEGLAPIEINGNWGYVDKSGKQAIPCIYEHVGSFSEGLAYVEISGKYGFIDTKGNQVAPCIYDYAIPFLRDLLQLTSTKSGDSLTRTESK